jgi:hypothetical protein
VGDAAHDLNALAASLGLTFEKAAAVLTEAAKAENDPLRRARRIVRSYERQKHKDHHQQGELSQKDRDQGRQAGDLIVNPSWIEARTAAD